MFKHHSFAWPTNPNNPFQLKIQGMPNYSCSFPSTITNHNDHKWSETLKMKQSGEISVRLVKDDSTIEKKAEQYYARVNGKLVLYQSTINPCLSRYNHNHCYLSTQLRQAVARFYNQQENKIDMYIDTIKLEGSANIHIGTLPTLTAVHSDYPIQVIDKKIHTVLHIGQLSEKRLDNHFDNVPPYTNFTVNINPKGRNMIKLRGEGETREESFFTLRQISTYDASVDSATILCKVFVPPEWLL